jgi:hypothetical protein
MHRKDRLQVHALPACLTSGCDPALAVSRAANSVEAPLRG